MTIHYHGTPISPMNALLEMKGRCFCVSFARPQNVRRCHEIGQSIMLDNGAYNTWTKGTATNWPAYYAWVDEWLDYPETWAVIPDVIDGTEEQQDELIKEWPYGDKGAPVWHMNESLDRLVDLTEFWPLVCMGSTKQYAVVLSEPWQTRMDDAWDAISRRHHRTPKIHMLRGLNACGKRWPFARADSTNIARNHNRQQNTPREMADRIDAIQCPAVWRASTKQMELL